MTIAHDVSTPELDQPVAAQPADLQAAWKRWHISRQRDLAIPHGWLSLTQFQWLVFADVSDGLRVGRRAAGR